MTTIVILGIVASIAAPEYWRMRDRDLYRGEGQQFFDTILDARNAALTNKLCNDDTTSVRWMVSIVPSADPMTYQLLCYSDSTNTVEQQSVSLDRSIVNTIDFNDTQPPTATDGGANPHPALITISFFSGGVNARIESDGDKMDEMQMVIGHNEASYVHTICFNRVSGYPTFNKAGDTCQTY